MMNYLWDANVVALDVVTKGLKWHAWESVGRGLET